MRIISAGYALSYAEDPELLQDVLDIGQDVEAAVGDLRFDIIVDDGCHTNTCIWNSWKALLLSMFFPKVRYI
jgi:UTP:GlnB (protein PII) uridylyltransferase